MIRTLHKWHQTKLGLLIFGLIELAVAYAWASFAIDQGNFVYYLLALIFFIGALQNIFKLIGKFIHGGRQNS